MVLRRFTRGAAAAWSTAATRVRGADWYALAAEFVLIVAGIMIAFQLDRWAESWGRSSDRALYLERLAEEASRNAEVLGFQLEGFREDTAALRRLLVALPEPAARARYAADGDGACGLLRLPAVNLQGAAMAEHGALGIAELLDDPPLRRAIRRASAADAFTAGQLDYFRASFQRYASRLDPYVLSRFDPASGETRCTVAADALAADPVAASIVAQIHVDRINFARMREEQRGDHRLVAVRARCVRAGDCPPVRRRGRAGRQAPDPTVAP